MNRLTKRVKQLIELGLEVDSYGNWSHENITISNGAVRNLFTWGEVYKLGDEAWDYEIEDIKQKLLKYSIDWHARNATRLDDYLSGTE